MKCRQGIDVSLLKYAGGVWRQEGPVGFIEELDTELTLEG